MRTPTLAATLALALALPAFTATAQEMTTESLAVVDTNGDGVVTKEELIAAMDAAFQQLDTDKSGSLSETEAVVWIPVAQFRAADKSANGQLSKDEFIAVVLTDFAAADKDGDGQLN